MRTWITDLQRAVVIIMAAQSYWSGTKLYWDPENGADSGPPNVQLAIGNETSNRQPPSSPWRLEEFAEIGGLLSQAADFQCNLPRV